MIVSADWCGATLDDPRRRKLGLARSLLLRGRCRNASPVPGFHPTFDYGGPSARGRRQGRLEASTPSTILRGGGSNRFGRATAQYLPNPLRETSPLQIILSGQIASMQPKSKSHRTPQDITAEC